MQKSIDDVVREEPPAQVGGDAAQAQSGRPRRVTRSRASDRGGKIARSATGRGAFERFRRRAPQGGSERREPVSAFASKLGNERSRRGSDRSMEAASGRGVRTLFTSVRRKRPRPNRFAFPMSERSGNAQARRQERQRLARFKDERTNAIFEIVRGIKNRLTRGRKRRRGVTGRVAEACGAS